MTWLNVNLEALSYSLRMRSLVDVSCDNPTGFYRYRPMKITKYSCTILPIGQQFLPN